MDVVIREEAKGDRIPIREVNWSAFGTEIEADLVDRLRAEGLARLSLVAEAGEDGLVGHILFSEVQVGEMPVLALAPMAVKPEWQRRGVGTQLVETGLKLCQEAGHKAVLVVGHPAYYPRFGFSVERAKGLNSPFSGEAFMVLELGPGALDGVTAEVQYPPAFDVFL
tara:strand:+ start:1184 stop:1684 length:501 start_codon:yes stop_codon:yes gene_type:complete